MDSEMFRGTALMLGQADIYMPHPSTPEARPKTLEIVNITFLTNVGGGVRMQLAK